MTVFSEAAEGFVNNGIHPANMPRVCETVGFVSAVGGSGTTSAAQTLSRIYSTLFEYKTLYISLDYMASKASIEPGTLQRPTHLQGREAVYSLLFENQSIAGKLIRDDLGVFGLPKDSFRNPLHFLAEEQMHRLMEIFEANFDRIVLDIPLNCPLSSYALDISDTVVVCKSRREDGIEAGTELYDHLKTARDGVISFAPEYEENLSKDIYGHFGMEVRGLAETIEGR